MTTNWSVNKANHVTEEKWLAVYAACIGAQMMSFWERAGGFPNPQVMEVMKTKAATLADLEMAIKIPQPPSTR
jgi:hypothetical protein